MSHEKRRFIYLLENVAQGIKIFKIDENHTLCKWNWVLLDDEMCRNCHYVSDIIKNIDAKIEGEPEFEYLAEELGIDKKYCYKITRKQFDRINKIERLANKLKSLMEEYCPNVFYKESK